MTKKQEKPAQEPEQEVLDKEQAEAEQAVAIEDLQQEASGLQRVASVEGTALQAYGDRQVMRELVDRMMAFHPAAAEVGLKGMRAVAQLAILYGASPLPGTNEIHVWAQNKSYKDENGQWQKRKVVTVQLGINYHERRAAMYGGVEWLVPERPFDEIDYELYGLDFKTHFGALCIGARAAEVERKAKQGWNIKEAQQAARIMGLGSVARSEDPKEGRPLIWTAMKRCRTDFYRKAFPHIPGEVVPPGPGMRWDAEAKAYVPTYNIHWGALNPMLDEGERDVPEGVATGDVNEMLFGEPGATEIIVGGAPGKDNRSASEYLK